MDILKHRSGPEIHSSEWKYERRHYAFIASFHVEPFSLICLPSQTRGQSESEREAA